MLRLIFFLFIGFFIDMGAKAGLSSNLITCEKSCECPSPYLPIKTLFKTSKASVHLGQCGLDLSLIMESMECLEALGIERSRACSIEGAIAGKLCFDKSPLPNTYHPTMNAPQGCGYKWRGFSLERYKKIVEEYLQTQKIRCAPSMCTSAAFLALASKAKDLFHSGKISQKQYFELTTPQQKGYVMLNSNAEPNQLVEAYGIGSGHVQYRGDKELGKDGVPAAGDLVQIWRNNSSGHSVVFKGFVDKNNDGEPDLLCYWSSQTATDGYGDRCETTDDMDRILIGHFK